MAPRDAPDDVEIAPVTDERACAAIWGPLAREILAPITDADLSNDGFPYLSARRITVADIPVDAVRISYAGELGWELTSASADGAGAVGRALEGRAATRA